MTVHALVPRYALSVLCYSECKTAKVFRGFTPGPQWGKLTVPPQLPSCTTDFLLATLVPASLPSKKKKKNTRYNTVSMKILHLN